MKLNKKKYYGIFKAYVKDKYNIVELMEREICIPLASIHEDYLNVYVIPQLQKHYILSTVINFKTVRLSKY